MRVTRRVALPAAFVACLLAVLLAPAAAAALPADTPAGGADTPATLSAVDQGGPLADLVARCDLSATDIAPGESVTLDASASQDATTYRYDKFGSGEFGDFLESATRTFTYQEVGTYEPQVRAVNATTEATDQAACGTLTVSESNQAPAVDFSYSPTEPAPEEAVSFSAEASDADGDVVEYVWRIDGEPVAEGPSFEYAFPGPGEYTVELAVTDNDGATDTATRTVTVTDSTTDGNGARGSSTFDADDEGWRIAGDAQGDGTAPDYLESGGNPGGHICANDNVAGGTWYFSAPAGFLGDRTGVYGGTLAFDIKQSSTDEQFAQDDLVLRNGTTTIVYDFGNATAHPGTDWTAYSVPLDATDPGWTYDSGGDVSPAAFRTLLGNLTSLSIRGEYVSGSDRGCLDNVRLSSSATENQPPTADFVFDPSTPAPGEAVAFEATATDGEGEVTAYQWRVDGELVAEGPSFEYAFPGPGEYTVELTVTDDDGATESVSKTVTVAEGNQAPAVGLDLSPAAPAPGEEVAFVAEATDRDGEVVSYRWTVDDRTVGERPELTYTFEGPGTYVVAVTATDDDGATASASREVTVEGDEQTPTATPTPTPTPAGDLTLSAAWWHSPTAPLRGEPVTLVASGPADSAVTYQWDVDDDGSYETQGALASHVFTTAGDHAVTLQATLSDGSTKTTTETVAVADETVSQPGTADTVLWHAPVNPRPDETVTLVADVQAAAGTVAAYRWDVDGDGQTDATGEVVAHTYPTEGRYPVDLTVEYSNGSTTTGVETVVVGDAPEATATRTATATATRTATATATRTATATATGTTTNAGTPGDTPAGGTTGGGSPGFGLTAGLAAFALLAARLLGNPLR